MSVRYVWDEYQIKFPSPVYSNVSEISHTSSFGSSHTHLDPVATDSYTQSVSGDKVIYSAGANSEDIVNNLPLFCSKYPYVVFKNKSFNHLIAHMTSGRWYRDDTSGTSSATYRLKWTSNENANIVQPNLTASPFELASSNISDCSAGSFIRSVSKSSYNYYPSDGVDGNLWYTYKGEDVIDPESVSVPGNISPNKQITINVTPSSSKLYGGTISYTLQYRLNGYSTWTTIDTTTSTSVSFTIPANTTSIQFRALAQDDMGFTSSTYVTSNTYEVNKYIVSVSASPANGGTVTGGGSFYDGTSATVTATPVDGYDFVNWREGNTTVGTSLSYTFTVSGNKTLTAVFKQKLALWVGINGKARKGVELYVGVNGKARKVTGAWVGVNGKARRFL